MAGVDVSEADILKIAPIDTHLNITISENIEKALNQFHPTVRWQAGGIDPADLAKMSRKGSFLATIEQHSVVVTKVENGVVHVMDPWGAGPGTGEGIVATIKESEFLKVWKGFGVFPAGKK